MLAALIAIILAAIAILGLGALAFVVYRQHTEDAVAQAKVERSLGRVRRGMHARDSAISAEVGTGRVVVNPAAGAGASSSGVLSLTAPTGETSGPTIRKSTTSTSAATPSSGASPSTSTTSSPPPASGGVSGGGGPSGGGYNGRSSGGPGGGSTGAGVQEGFALPSVALPAASSDWMYLTDSSGSHFLQGGIAAASAWLRDGAQVQTGSCVREDDGTAAGASSLCFGSGGMPGVQVRGGPLAVDGGFSAGWFKSPAVFADQSPTSASPGSSAVTIETASTKALATGPGVRLGDSWRIGATPGGGSVASAKSGLFFESMGAKIPIAQMNSRGVGILLPTGQSPAAALDVGGDARISGRLCVGSACIDSGGLASVSESHAQIASLQNQMKAVLKQIAALQTKGPTPASAASAVSPPAAPSTTHSTLPPATSTTLSTIASSMFSPSTSSTSPMPALVYDATSLASLPPGPLTTSWPNTGTLGSSYGAIGGGSTPPALVTKDHSVRLGAFVRMTAAGNSFLTIPGAIRWPLQSAGASFTVIAVVRFAAGTASTLVEFGGGGGKPTDALTFVKDTAGQLGVGYYAGQAKAGWLATGVNSGIVSMWAGEWTVYAARLSANPGGGTQLALYSGGAIIARSTSPNPLPDRTSVTNLINQSSAGGGAADVDLAELRFYDSPMTDMQVYSEAQALEKKWVLGITYA